MSELDAEVIKHALKTAREFGFRTVRLKKDGAAFRGVLTEHQEDSEDWNLDESAMAEVPVGPIAIEAPAVGYYREAREPLQPGRKVMAGEVVAIVSALGLDNDVISPASGEVVEVLVRPDQPLEYGQAIAHVLPPEAQA